MPAFRSWDNFTIKYKEYYDEQRVFACGVLKAKALSKNIIIQYNVLVQ